MVRSTGRRRSGISGLQADEALLESAFTPEACRGQRIMSCAMSQITEQARALNARWVLTFVADDNIASLKSCARSGFVPYVRRHAGWFLFRRFASFTPILEESHAPPAEAKA